MLREEEESSMSEDELVERIEHDKEMFRGYKKRLELELEKWSVFQHAAKLTGGKCLTDAVDCQVIVNDILEEAWKKMRATNKRLDDAIFKEDFQRRPRN